jgi:inorganic pyrophosphatase/mannose-6-phosphate isomerase-like protein (cupin superfamily)
MAVSSTRVLWLLFMVALPGVLAAQSTERAPDTLPGRATTQLSRSLEAAATHASHVWRDTPPLNNDGSIIAYIEIPKGDRRKWEFDIRGNTRAIDRVMPEEIGGYPVNYGFVPQTVSYDGDPFDALVLGPALAGGQLVRGAIVGLMLMEDEKGLDSKVVLSTFGGDGRPVHNLTAEDRRVIGDFFRGYKQYESGKFSQVPGWGSIAQGLAYVQTTHAFFLQCGERSGVSCRVSVDPQRPTSQPPRFEERVAVSTLVSDRLVSARIVSYVEKHPKEDPMSLLLRFVGRISDRSLVTRSDMIQSTMTAVSIPPGGGNGFDFGGFGVQWKIDGPSTEQRFAIVHHPLAPRALAAPLHYHRKEDEFSYVLTGTLGALLGEKVVTARAGTWVFKPRRQWHTFWNAGDEPCEIIEIISPAGFENYFREVASSWGDTSRFAAINAKYSVDMRFESVPDLCERFGLTFPPL